MNPLSMETMFLILSGVILAAGVLYWFWSHLQLVQKKVQLLENAVFELRGMLAPIHESELPAPEPVATPLPYTDLEDEWPEETAPVSETPPAHVVEPVEEDTTVTVTREEPVSTTPELIKSFETMYKEVDVEKEETQTLEGMTVKDLRRMASERGISGSSEMKKKDLVAALRNTVTPP